MPFANTPTTYGSVTRSFHWLTALLILVLIPVAVIANRLPYETSEQLSTKAFLFSLHKTLGVAVFGVAALRILWALTQTKPAPLHPERRTQTFLAETAHWLLYGSLVLAPLSGWIHHASTTGFAPIWWPLGQSLPLVPKSATVEAVTFGLHWVFGKVMVATILLHIAGAAKHAVIDRDATLARMLHATPGLRVPAPRNPSAKPVLAALAVWAAVLAGAGAFGLYGRPASPQASAQLQEVASEWTVQDGTIAIVVTQFGTAVEGSFADWTADITFDPALRGAQSGTVDVVISTGSLTLGSVTNQALGPDFFNVQGFPTAHFKADLISSVDGFTARGTLNLRGQSVPVEMPFRLSLQQDTAQMHAELRLDRRDFGIGDNMTDEKSLGFTVDAKISLTATRPATQ
jgi:cytochrome b561/polyisoprenoid-binding protein YceI